MAIIFHTQARFHLVFEGLSLTPILAGSQALSLTQVAVV